MYRRRALLQKGVPLLLVACLLGVRVAPALAQGAVPTKLALLVMLRVLTYDKNFATRGSGDFVVLVAYEPSQESSRNQVLDAAAELRETSIQSRPLKFVSAPISSPKELKDAAAAQGAQAIVAVQGTSATAASIIAEVAREQKLYSLTLDPALAEKGIALSVVSKEGRPQLLVNAAAAKDVNASFEPTVLKLARIIQ